MSLFPPDLMFFCYVLASSPNLLGPIDKACSYDHSALLTAVFLLGTISWHSVSILHLLIPFFIAEARYLNITRLPCGQNSELWLGLEGRVRERCVPALQAADKVKETCWTVGVIQSAFQQ